MIFQTIFLLAVVTKWNLNKYMNIKFALIIINSL